MERALRSDRRRREERDDERENDEERVRGEGRDNRGGGEVEVSHRDAQQATERPEVAAQEKERGQQR